MNSFHCLVSLGFFWGYIIYDPGKSVGIFWKKLPKCQRIHHLQQKPKKRLPRKGMDGTFLRSQQKVCIHPPSFLHPRWCWYPRFLCQAPHRQWRCRMLRVGLWKFLGRLDFFCVGYTPRKINGWNPEHDSVEVWKIIFLSKWVICRFHVNLPGYSCFKPQHLPKGAN